MKKLEDNILNLLKEQDDAISIVDLGQMLKLRNSDLKMVDIKIAVLCLVSNGKVKMDQDWKVSKLDELEIDAYYFICKKPGKRMCFASVDDLGTEALPFEEWESIVRYNLTRFGNPTIIKEKK